MPSRFRSKRLLAAWFALSLIGFLSLGSIHHGQLGRAAVAQTFNADRLVQTGVSQYQAGDYPEAIATWKTALTLYQQSNNSINQAIVLENLARAHQAIGQVSNAIVNWEEAIATYRQRQDLPQMGRMMTEQAQAYARLGQYRQAIALLCGQVLDQAQADQLADQLENRPAGKPAAELACQSGTAVQIAQVSQNLSNAVAALGSLGEAYRLKGSNDAAEYYLQTALPIAQALANPLYLSSIQNSLGNIYVSRAQLSYRRAQSAAQTGSQETAIQFKAAGEQFDRQASQFFQQSFTTAQQQHNRSGQLRAQMALISIYRRLGDRSATATLQQSVELLNQLPPAQEKIYAAIDLAKLLQQDAPNSAQSVELLHQAIAEAKQIGNPRSLSFALGELGRFYEGQPDYLRAMDLTQQARLAAEKDLDSRYLWEWQTGRILKAKGQVVPAIDAYEKSITTLETIRGDILVSSQDVQFDFRDAIEPIYRQLMQIRLGLEQPAVSLPPESAGNVNVDATLTTLDSLKLAELQNYFGNDCVLTAMRTDRAALVGEGTETAVISSVILPDRTGIVLSLPNQTQQLSWINISADQLTQEVNLYRRGLEKFADAPQGYVSTQAEKLYDWIIRPFESSLTDVKTLVFIQDGILRSVPMSALHDGQQFLIQKYAIATTPSLNLTDAKPLNRQRLRALAIGLTQEAVIDQQKFPALKGVEPEIEAIVAELPGSDYLKDGDFTFDRLKQVLQDTPYPIIHIATHAEFSTDPKNTFLVTGDSQKLVLSDLDDLLRSVVSADRPIELLSLTACKTAAGDDRAALGLAGAAAQAGVKSVIASLWAINDATTADLFKQFYSQLQMQSKAEALRSAQLKLIEPGGRSAHPAYWAPFVLIGNWL